MRYFASPDGRVKVVEAADYTAYVTELEFIDRWVIVRAEGVNTHVALYPNECRMMVHCPSMGVQEESAMLTALLLLATGEYFTFDKMEVHE